MSDDSDWIKRVQRWLLFGIGWAIFGLAMAALFGNDAHGQMLMPDGFMNPACAALPRPVPLPVPAASAPTGLPPDLGGSCTAQIYEINQHGAAAAWWCTTIKAPPADADLWVYAVLWESVTPGMLADWAQLALAGTDKKALILSMSTRYQTLNILDMCDVWSPMVARVNAARPKPPAPPAAAYVVTPGTPRPAYAVANGKRSLTPTGAATPGQPCDCLALQIVEFGVFRYCAAPSITIPAPAVTSCSAGPK